MALAAPLLIQWPTPAHRARPQGPPWPPADRGRGTGASLDGVATLYAPSGPPIEIRLDECTVPSQAAAIALIENVGGELVVRREAKYLLQPPGVSKQESVDHAYGWGMTWHAASKD